MPIHDVVTLGNGQTGVVGRKVSHDPVMWRVFFRNHHMDVAPDFISSTLSAPSYEVGDSVEVWPETGTIQAIDGTQITVRIEKRVHLGNDDYAAWTADNVYPEWKVTRWSDSRIDADAVLPRTS